MRRDGQRPSNVPERNRQREVTINTTIFHDIHIALGAKMAPFGGYDMPIQYSGIIKEHSAAREGAAIFDTCHMSEFSLKGPNVVADLDALLSCSVASMKTGQCRYGFLCNEQGGVVDDQIIYRMGDEEFFMVVNASTGPTDFEWVSAHLSPSTRIENITPRTAKLDLQGPGSVKIMAKLMALPIDGMKYYTWMRNRYQGAEVLISRTGYTGEIGFELYCAHDLAKAFWAECLALGVVPAGLGARDTLRLEMGLPLYGHELDAATNAAESGLSRSIAADKKFIGSAVVLDPEKKKRLLAGIVLQGRRSARNGDLVLNASGGEIGVVTSGSFAPSLGVAVALAYVPAASAVPGTTLMLRVGGQELAGVVTPMPFYTKATGRMDIKKFL